MKLIAYDLGTGGVKASLYDDALTTLSRCFIEYDTLYPGPGMHEQQPLQWWQGVCLATKRLLEESGTPASDVACISLSGQSLVTVPLGADGQPLAETVPIWSDTRAASEAAEFFEKVPEREWYLTTGNGFPPPCYSIFKLMWLKKHHPSLFAGIKTVLGSKDFINYKLCGAVATDPSYASGTGAYSLKKGALSKELLAAAGLPPEIFPPILPSHQVVGHVTAAAARATGLAEGTAVACGGVDNACMALGAVGAGEGRVYTSLGSSSWIPVNSAQPVLDFEKRPYVFAHIQPGMFTSAFSIFSGGSSLRWIRDELCPELAGRNDAYAILDEWAAGVPVGSGGILFNPSLAGGTSQDKSRNIRGAFVGLQLGTTRKQMVRAAMEGIALNLRLSLDYLRQHTPLSSELLFCGGGSKSAFWMQMFADVFDMTIVKTSVDQDAASVGAAAIAARALGWWQNYNGIDALHTVQHRSQPQPQNTALYQKLLPVFAHATNLLADLGDYMAENSL